MLLEKLFPHWLMSPHSCQEPWERHLTLSPNLRFFSDSVDLIEKIYKAFKGFTATEHRSLMRGTKASPRLRAEGGQHEHQ